MTGEHLMSHTYLTIDNKPNVAFLVLSCMLFSEFFLITVQYFYHGLQQQYTTAFLLKMFSSCFFLHLAWIHFFSFHHLAMQVLTTEATHDYYRQYDKLQLHDRFADANKPKSYALPCQNWMQQEKDRLIDRVRLNIPPNTLQVILRTGFCGSNDQTNCHYNTSIYASWFETNETVRLHLTNLRSEELHSLSV